MVKTVTTINGRYVEKPKARISVFDNSLLYAEGLFETFLAVGDQPVFADEHLDRMFDGAQTIGLTIPVGRRTLISWMRRTLRKHPSRIKKLRLTATAGESARWLGQQGKPQVILSAAPHELPTDPFRLLVSDFKVDHLSEFRQVKTISYAINAAALREAHRRGYDDALLLNQRGSVAEVTSANIFWIEDGQIHTPPTTAGCLEGVTRKVVLREAQKLGLAVHETKCPMICLEQTKEVFISSSLKLIMPVGEIRSGRRRFRFKPGPIARELEVHFRKLAEIE